MANEPETNAREERAVRRGLPRGLLFGISFFGGLQIMALEICGFRVLQTHLGSSVIVTGTLLTLIMVLLSAGYFLGGFFSTRVKDPVGGMLALLLAGTLYSVLLNGVLLEQVASLTPGMRHGVTASFYLRTLVPAAYLTLVLYGLPVLVMSMISPCLIQMRTTDPTDEKTGPAGSEAGIFMSLSTIGSIGGVVAASYILVPFSGVKFTALLTSAVFFILVSAAWVIVAAGAAGKRRFFGACALGGLFFACVAMGLRDSPRDPDVAYQAESHYGELRVLKRQDAAGRTILTYHPSRVYVHSMLYPDEPLRDLRGNMYFVSGFLRPPASVLVLGSAAGGAIRGLELAFPAARLTGVDLDPKVHEVATEVFGVDAPRAKLVAEDARVFLSETKETFDLIVIDLFAGEFIPTHCISVEFFRLVRQRLSPGGSVFINTNMNDIPFEGGGDFRALRHLDATLYAAGFRTLIENAFFNSLFVFPESLPISEFRAGLERVWRDEGQLAPLRAAAALAYHTSFAVPADYRSYRPYSDSWVPNPLIESKSNASSVYAGMEKRGLEETARTSRRDLVSEAVLTRLLRQHFWERRVSNETGFRDVEAVIGTLNEVKEPEGAGDLDAGARYLQFSDKAFGKTGASLSPWARHAGFYARLYELGYANEYEKVLGLVNEAPPAP